MSLAAARPGSDARRIAILCALIGALAYAWCFYPGAMSADSTYAWWFARGGESDNVQGVGLVWLWRLTDAWLQGPAGPFVVFQALLWGGLALVAVALPLRASGRVAFMLAAAGAPVCFVLFSHVWSDVALMAALTAALGTLLRFRDGGRPVWLVGALCLLWWSLTLRHNALPAAAALFVYAMYLWHRRRADSVRARRWHVAAAVGLASAMWLTSSALDRAVDHRVSILPSLALWDLAAISVKIGTVLLPVGSYGPGLDVDDLRQAYSPYTNVKLFTSTRAGIGAPFLDPGDPLDARIRAAWLDAIREHPAAYLSHRWRLTRALFGTRKREWPHELVYVDGDASYRTNPPIAPNTTAAHVLLLRAFEAGRDTLLLAAWPYLLLALFAAAHAWRRRRSANAQAALAVLASGLVYAAPLPLIAPSAELRYLGWTCMAALLGAALAFTARRVRDPSAAYPPAP